MGDLDGEHREIIWENLAACEEQLFAEVCQWILTAWSCLKSPMGFEKAGLLRGEEDNTSSSANVPPDESDDQSDNERETKK